ncbi:hypothetical protein ABES02_04420 [Neobacillus pocheonensis]|uniref:NACHT domain-containing protein n=1 Tax=Neobacillus pocheonensis TaxID=363869 RepID=UPI003D29D6BA
MIDWSKLKPYDTDQKRSFEELCYQIARVQFEEKGRFTSVDDSGGGDGVEFYLTLPTGEEWGWQAKFYVEGRLTNGRKSSIIGSLKKSCEMHPNLKKWFLCVPLDLTVGENDWFQHTLSRTVPEGMEVEFIFWGDSYFNHQLADPRFAGRKNYFFGELELTFDWFKNQVLNQLTTVKGKYNPAVHTHTQVDQGLNSFLMNDEYKQYIRSQHHILTNEFSKFKSVILNLEKVDRKYIPLGIKKEILASIQDTNVLINKIFAFMELEVEFPNDSNYSSDNSQGVMSDYNELVTQIGNLRDIIQTVYEKKLIITDEMNDHQTYELRKVRNTIWEPIEFLEEFLYDVQNLVKEMDKGSWKNLFIFGNAGFGKTHVSAHICRQTIEKGLPIIFIPGKNLSDHRSLTEQLRGILDIPASYSWNDFLHTLDNTGKVFRTKIPIFIDGFNEVRDLQVIKNGLPSFLQEISNFSNISLIGTCRTTYIKAIWGDRPENALYMSGFTGEDIEEAVNRYFNYYKIIADTSSITLEQFQHPLYLQIFCQTKNPERNTETRVYINEQSMFNILDAYLNQCDTLISEKLGLHPRRKDVLKRLKELGRYLWDNNTRFIPLETATDILDGDRLGNWNNSLEKHLTDENLLIYRDWKREQDEEVISFTYDLLGGYLIASYLLQRNKDSLLEFFNDQYTISLLFGEEFNARHPLHEDINRCLAALLPVFSGKYLMDYNQNKETLNVTVHSWFEMSPEYVNEKALTFIKELFLKDKRNQILLFKDAEKTIRQVRHPLNIQFWSTLLLDLSMPDRDVSWSEHIRRHQKEIEKTVDALEKKSKQVQEGDNEIDYLTILAENVMWVLTVTVRPLRDKATRALYYFGRVYPEELFRLLKYSFTINDPYVSERLLAAVYGVTMARQYDFRDNSFKETSLPIIAQTLYELMFKDGAKYSTTHILARDYAKRTIDIALIHNPNLLSEEEKNDIQSPFQKSSDHSWGDIEKDELSDYGSNPIRMDFGNYTIGRLVKDRSNYDYEHDDYKKVRAHIYWRINDLGYSSKLFKEIDDEIENKNYSYGRSDDGRKTDRYGKKYSWIAFYEMAGYRKDLGLLDDEWSPFRISDTDIDPSFPKEVTKFKLVTNDYLSDYFPIKEWLYCECSPNFDEYFTVNEINGDKGPWVLLDGYFSDENERKTRSCFFFTRGILVKSKDYNRVYQLLKNQDLGGQWLPEVPDDHYVYAGEIPWAETFPENDEIDLEFITSRYLESVNLEKDFLMKNGKELSQDEVSKVIDLLIEEGELDWFQTFFSNPNDFSKFESFLVKHQISVEKRDVKIENEKQTMEKYKVLLPVRENSWEENGSEVIPGRNVVIPSKQITSTLGLVNQPQTFDLFEKNGAKASVTVEFGEIYRNHQQFTFIRKDLLDKFLDEKDYKLIWGLWGEREISYKSESFRNYFLKQYGDVRNNFQEIILYSWINE